MTIIVKVGEAKTHLSELLAKVEAGEDVIIARGHAPVARLSRIRHATEIADVIQQIKAVRLNRPKTKTDEIRVWRDAERRV